MFKTILLPALALTVMTAQGQPTSAIQFYDTTGAHPTVQFGWRGGIDGEFYLQMPDGTDGAVVKDGNLSVSGAVSAASFSGDGSGLEGIALLGHSHSASEIFPGGITGAQIQACKLRQLGAAPYECCQ